MYGQYSHSENAGRRLTVAEVKRLTAGSGVEVKRVGHNRFLLSYLDGRRAFRLHDTNVVTLSADGKQITLDDGGWDTMTTRRAMAEGIEVLVGLRLWVWGARPKHAHSLKGFGGFDCPLTISVEKLKESVY